MNERMFGPAPVRERGARSPFAWVEWYPEVGHGHMYPLGDGIVNVLDLGMGIEDVAIDLADAVALCSEDRHDGHGKTHSQDEIKDAFSGAISQLLINEFDNEWRRTEWLREMYVKWGGHIPAAVLVPKESDSRQWELMMPDRHGDPVFYDIKTEMYQDVPGFEPPTEIKGIQKLDYGWKLPRKWSARRRQDWLEKRGT